MKTKYFKIIFVFLLSILVINCSDDKKETENKDGGKTTETKNSKKENLNISILLDLSDRINPKKYPNPTMEYYQRDLGYIETISKNFENHLKGKPIRQTDDQIQVFFEPEPLNPAINSLSKNLKLSFNKNNTSKENISKISSVYRTNSTKIYKLAIADKNFDGADIWKFFKNKVKDYCIKNNHRNILIILTDGYIYHKDSKFTEGNKSSFITPEFIREKKLNTSNYKETFVKNNLGFIPATQNLDNLEVIVIGINPSKKNPYEEEVINLYWENWFKNMGIKKTYIKEADLPTNIGDVLENIILNK